MSREITVVEGVGFEPTGTRGPTAFQAPPLRSTPYARVPLSRSYPSRAVRQVPARTAQCA